MAIQKKDYFTFLGGEVSPNLFKRVDMRAANKWFETAKNIFFDTTGGFFNRVGTEVIDNSYVAGQKIKLLKFIYNKSQSFSVIFASDNIKIYDNKTLKYTISSGLPDYNLIDDIIYTQIGDVMYICFGNSTKIYILKRLADDNWVFEEFNYDIPPMLEINDDKENTLTLSVVAPTTYRLYSFNLKNKYLHNAKKLCVYLSKNYVETKIYEYSYHEGEGLDNGLNSFSEFVSDFNNHNTSTESIIASYSNDILYFKTSTDCTVRLSSNNETDNDGLYTKQITDFTTYYTYPNTQTKNGVTYPDYHVQNSYTYSGLYANTSRSTQSFERNNNNANAVLVGKIKYKTAVGELYLSGQDDVVLTDYNNEYTWQNMPRWTALCSSITSSFPPPSSTFQNATLIYDNQSSSTSFKMWSYGYLSDGQETYYGLVLEYLEYYKRDSRDYISGTYIDYTQNDGTTYSVSSSNNIFADKNVGDTFCIESVFSPSPDGTAGINKTVSSVNLGNTSGYLPSESGFWSNGTWRLVTCGIWAGNFQLQYSYDGTTWYTHRTFTSSVRTENNISYSTNYNEYGTLDTDDTVKLRLKYSASSSSNNGVTFDTDSFENRSYYKIIDKTSSSVVTASCIKYDVGFIGTTYQWAESAWSDTEGYPAICFTYQNRLCFAKTNGNPFVVWTSRTNDYGSFDTKIKYQDDDPITMDVVKFNGVSNIATVAALNKLFIFTEDAEYGIQDQGALTQANKSLIAFSKYGAEPLETQVSGNRIVFVEHGGKAARQLFYDFAQENYEAPDITVLYKHLLKNEKIIATDYIGLDYRTYLMLTSAGRVICYKYIPEQEITACSWFMHAKGTITNISALDVSNNTVRIYMAVDINGRKQLEVMDLTNESYLDSRYTFTTDTATTTIDTTGHFDNDDEVCYFLNGIKYTATIENNTLTLEEEIPANTELEVGYPYEAEATLIPMSAIARNGSANYTKKNIFKANFEYFDSVAFKVGMKSYQDEFEEIKYEDGVIGTENTPHSGEKDDIIILSSYLDKNMLSFKQSEPYKMNISNLQVEVDYGG